MNIREKLNAIWDRICWNAWNYARKRELAKKAWPTGAPPVSSDDDTLDQRRIKANEARQVLENRHFIDAFNAVDRSLEAKALACDTGVEGSAERIILAKQLLHGVRRELSRKLDDGYMAEVELNEIEKKRRMLRFQR